MAEASKLGGDRVDGARNLGVNGGWRVNRPADAQPGRLTLSGGQKRFRGFRPVGVARQMAGHRVETQGRVSDRPRDDAARGQPGPILTEHRAAGDRAARWFQPDDATTGSGDSNRAATVSAMAERTQTSSHGGGGPAAGAAGGPGLVDGIPGWRKHRAFGHRPGAELRRVRFAQDRGAFVLQPADGKAVDLGNGFLEDSRAKTVAIAGERGGFLDGYWNSVQQAEPLAAHKSRSRGGCLAFGEFAGQQHVGIEFRVDSRNALVVERHQLSRLDGFLCDRLRLRQRWFEGPRVIDHPLTVSTRSRRTWGNKSSPPERWRAAE